MAEGGAYYAAAATANQVQPVSFGDIAMGFANIAESKRRESAEQTKYRQDFLMKQQELFGDEIVGEFDGTGIDNLDGVGSKLKTSIKRHAEILNSLYEDGKISESQLNSRLRKLSNESSQFRGLTSEVSNFVQKDDELGANSSNFNQVVLDRLNQFTQDMLPVVNENSEIVLLSREDGEKIQQTSLFGMRNMLSAKQGVKDADIFEGVMAGIKPTTQVKGKTVVSTYMPNGELSKNTKNYLNEQFNVMSDDQLIDLAVKNDIDYGGGLDIKDKEALKKNLIGIYEEKTKAYLTDQEAANEVEGIRLSIQRGNFKISSDREERAKKKEAEAERKMLDPQSTVVNYNEGQYAAKVWQTPLDKKYNIAPYLEGVALEHSGTVQLTQVQQINLGTDDNPDYTYRVSFYVPPSKSNLDSSMFNQLPIDPNTTPEQKEAYLNQLTGVSGHKYKTIDIDETNLLKLQKFLPDDFIEEQKNLNNLFQ
jgi:hypothetical protein